MRELMVSKEEGGGRGEERKEGKGGGGKEEEGRSERGEKREGGTVPVLGPCASSPPAVSWAM